jgi:cysteinyl-tRNA synthetase
MPLRLYDTLVRELRPFAPADPARVTFYSCGPTVYDDAHIGNFRSFLAADTLRRFLESPMCEVTGPDGRPHAGPRRVVHVMNITDVGHMTDDAEGGEGGEDRMAVAGRRLLEAKKAGALPKDSTLDPADPYAIAGFYAERFLADARLLGLKVALEAREDPTLMPRPTKKIRQMVEMIRTLMARGHAYTVGPAGRRVVYFAVESFAAYGRLSGNTLERLRVGAGGRVSGANTESKRHPADFLLWKADPAHVMKWDPAEIDPALDWGAGYPGWHIECSAMAAERLAGPDGTIDLHSGGEDNIFPHHECELAQSCCAHGTETFSRSWFHPRHLFVEGAKMSKSKGNFFTIRDLTAKGYEPAAIRLELIKTHYRTNANFTEQGLKDSARMVERWRRFADATAAGGIADARPHPATVEATAAFAAAMHEDLNVAQAVATINTWVGAVERPNAGDAAALRGFDAVLGVLGLERPAAVRTEIALFAPGVTPDPKVNGLLIARKEAKAARDFARADAIRDELAALGYAIKDAPGGRVEVSRR